MNMSDAGKRLHEAWAEYGYIYCEGCDERISLKHDDSFAEAQATAVSHHREEH